MQCLAQSNHKSSARLQELGHPQDLRAVGHTHGRLHLLTE